MKSLAKRHWPTLAVLLVLGVLYADARCNDLPRLRAEARAAQEAAAADSAEAQRWQQRAQADSARADSLARVAQAAQSQAQRADQHADRAAARLDDLPDTITIAQARPAIDSAMDSMRRARDHWRTAFMASMAENSALRQQCVSCQHALVAQRSRSMNLQRAVDALEQQLTAYEPPWLQTATLAAGGAGIGYAVAGGDGAIVGAAGGAAMSLLWYGLRSFLRP